MTIEHRPLGRTGVSVSKLCLGAMMFGAWGNPDHDESIRIIHAALDAGVNFIDTADVYSRGESEEIVGRPHRFDLSLPVNQRKLEVADALARLAEDNGITLIQMALAFVLNHPAITAPIIGPRTMEHLESQLAAAEVVLDAATLDRIDELVPPGTTPNQADAGWVSPALAPEKRRR